MPWVLLLSGFHVTHVMDKEEALQKWIPLSSYHGHNKSLYFLYEYFFHGPPLCTGKPGDGGWSCGALRQQCEMKSTTSIRDWKMGSRSHFY
jgi:hypothetical protein